VVGVVRLLYIPKALLVYGNATATANNVAAHESLFRLGIVSGLVASVLWLFVPLALYRLLKDSAANPYLIVGLDGVLETTDGQRTEEVIFPMNDAGAERARWVAIRMPAIWEALPRDSLVVEEQP